MKQTESVLRAWWKLLYCFSCLLSSLIYNSSLKVLFYSLYFTLPHCLFIETTLVYRLPPTFIHHSIPIHLHVIPFQAVCPAFIPPVTVVSLTEKRSGRKIHFIPGLFYISMWEGSAQTHTKILTGFAVLHWVHFSLESEWTMGLDLSACMCDLDDDAPCWRIKGPEVKFNRRLMHQLYLSIQWEHLCMYYRIYGILCFCACLWVWARTSECDFTLSLGMSIPLLWDWISLSYLAANLCNKEGFCSGQRRENTGDTSADRRSPAQR